MPHSKKKHKISRKKLTELAPKDYTILGNQHEFMRINPSSHARSRGHSVSHRVEKWVLLTLLTLAMAAFMGFKLLENSDMSFSISENTAAPMQSKSTNSLPSEEEFKAAFKHNREEARSLIQDRTKISKSKKAIANKKAPKKFTKKFVVAKKISKKKKSKRIVRIAKAKKSAIAKQ